MEQPRVQIQTEIRSEWINRVLACGKCLKYITTSGECECHEWLIPGRQDKNTMEFYRKCLLCLVKHYISIGVPNHSSLDENIDFRNETTGGRETFYYAANGLKVEFVLWDSEEGDSQETEDEEPSISSNLDPADPNSVSGLGTSVNQQNPNHSSQNIEQSLISNPSEGNMEGDEMLNYLQLRLTSVMFMSGKSAMILDILGQHLDWQQILQHVESDTVELRWRFYRIDGIFDEYDHTDYSEISVENHYGLFDRFEHIDFGEIHVEDDDYVLGSSADEFGDLISFDGHDDTEYEFALNADEFGGDGHDDIVSEFPLNAADEYEIIVPDDDNFNSGPRPASKSAMESLPTHVISVDSADADACCCICTDPIDVGDEVKTLPCNHFYHSECIIKWLGISNVCPLCRYELPSDIHEDQRQN